MHVYAFFQYSNNKLNTGTIIIFEILFMRVIMKILVQVLPCFHILLQ
jgi:hypothetical protein